MLDIGELDVTIGAAVKCGHLAWLMGEMGTRDTPLAARFPSELAILRCDAGNGAVLVSAAGGSSVTMGSSSCSSPIGAKKRRCVKL